MDGIPVLGTPAVLEVPTVVEGFDVASEGVDTGKRVVTVTFSIRTKTQVLLIVIGNATIFNNYFITSLTAGAMIMRMLLIYTS